MTGVSVLLARPILFVKYIKREALPLLTCRSFSFVARHLQSDNRKGELFARKFSNHGLTIQGRENETTDSLKNDSERVLDINFDELTNGDSEMEKNVKKIEFEVRLLREEHGTVPSKLKKDHWKNLLTLPTVSARRKYLTFLYKVEKKTENNSRRKEQKIKMRLERKLSIHEDWRISYNLGENSLFMRIYSQSISKLLNLKQLTNLMYSQPIILDCSYEEHMSLFNSSLCAKQLTHCFYECRLHPASFSVKLCNAQRSYKTIKKLDRNLSGIFNESFPWECFEESFLKLYPKEKFVYLSPHAKETLTTYSYDDIYIIGAYVDKGTGEKVSLGKAKEQNLRMAKLPLDNYLLWQKGLPGFVPPHSNLDTRNILNFVNKYKVNPAVAKKTCIIQMEKSKTPLWVTEKCWLRVTRKVDFEPVGKFGNIFELLNLIKETVEFHVLHKSFLNYALISR